MDPPLFNIMIYFNLPLLHFSLSFSLCLTSVYTLFLSLWLPSLIYFYDYLDRAAAMIVGVNGLTAAMNCASRMTSIRRLYANIGMKD